jgi:hypothetical protein
VKLFSSSQTRESSKTIYELKLYGRGPGVYWCEGHAIRTGELIRSKQVVARKPLDGFVFAVRLRSKVKPSKDPIYSENFLDSLTKKLKNLLKDDVQLNFYEKFIVENIKDIRVMKIADFSKESSLLTAIYHITILKAIDQSSEEYEDFMEKYAEKFNDVKVIFNHQMMSFLETIFKKIDGEAFKFLSTAALSTACPSQ